MQQQRQREAAASAAATHQDDPLSPPPLPPPHESSLMDPELDDLTEYEMSKDPSASSSSSSSATTSPLSENNHEYDLLDAIEYAAMISSGRCLDVMATASPSPTTDLSLSSPPQSAKRRRLMEVECDDDLDSVSHDLDSCMYKRQDDLVDEANIDFGDGNEHESDEEESSPHVAVDQSPPGCRRLSFENGDMEPFCLDSENLAASSEAFQKKTKEVRMQMFWRDAKTRLILGALALVVIGCIIGFSIWGKGLGDTPTHGVIVVPTATAH